MSELQDQIRHAQHLASTLTVRIATNPHDESCGAWRAALADTHAEIVRLKQLREEATLVLPESLIIALREQAETSGVTVELLVNRIISDALWQARRDDGPLAVDDFVAIRLRVTRISHPVVHLDSGDGRTLVKRRSDVQSVRGVFAQVLRGTQDASESALEGE